MKNITILQFKAWLTVVIMMFSLAGGRAQGWQRFYGNEGDQRAFALRITADGGLAIAGSSTDSSGSAQTDWYFIQTDSLGQVLQEHTWGSADTAESAVALFPMNGAMWIAGNQTWAFAGPGIDQRSGFQWASLDGQGMPQNGYFSTDFISLLYHATAFRNGQLLTGSAFQPIVDGYFPQPVLYFIDSSGALQWSVSLPFTDQYGDGLAAFALNADELLMAAYEYNAANNQTIRFQKIDFQGNVILERRLPTNQATLPAELLQTQDGQVLLVGQAQFPHQDLLLAKINPLTLDTVWTGQAFMPGVQLPHAAVELPNGKIAVAGEHIATGSNSRDAFLAMFSPTGQLQWFKTFGGLKGDIFWDIQFDPFKNKFTIAGQTASYSTEGDLQAWLLQADTSGQVWSSRIIGRVARDETQNCLVDVSEPALEQWIVAAAGNQGTVYGMTDVAGQYDLPVDTGAWFVSLLPVSGYWLPCEDSVAITLSNLNDSVSLDFPVQVLYECPLLDIDITTPFLRRCFDNQYFVRYFNYGTAPAAPATAAVVLDPYLTMIGSTLPYTIVGDSVLFDLGEVPPLSGGTFELTVFLSCDSSVLGQVHCTEAYVFPDSLCYSFDPDWDGAHLEVDGFCAGDSVVLTITNTGAGMQGPVEYIITEDQIIFRRDMLQLNEGQDTTIVVYPNGATLAILVEQTPGHPGNSQPMLVIEGCGAEPFSTGYAFQFPQNDGNPSVDIECKTNVGSFDPNDKAGFPAGVGNQGIIAADTRIEYLIRFQNTGTDTAFRVEIRDQLSPLLDIASLVIGASSHPNRWKISQSGLLHFIFDPIALPDSATHFDASSGFVKFSIKAKAGIENGSALLNKAEIYFDQNPPVETNTTLHTIGLPQEALTTLTIEPNDTKTKSSWLAVTPNPTIGMILVNLRQPFKSEGLQVEVLDMYGRCLQLQQIHQQSTDAISFNLAPYPSGVYNLVLRSYDGRVVDCRRIIKL